MPKISAGLMLYRKRNRILEVLLVHPGGPIWGKKDSGVWEIPKGEVDDRHPGEDLLRTAKREFEEEVGFAPDSRAEYISLGSVVQKSGKIVHAWAFEGDCDPENIKSNTFTMEWPPRSGRRQEFPEIDCAEFIDIEKAREKMVPTQVELFLRLREKVGG